MSCQYDTAYAHRSEEGMDDLKGHNCQQILGFVVALVGYLIVAFAYDFSMPILDGLAAGNLWFTGVIGLCFILVGIIITAVKR